MQITLDLWHLISLLITVLGASAAGGKLLLAQTQRHLDHRFDVQEKARSDNHDALSGRLDRMESVAREEMDNWRRIERDLLALKADMPLHYVRREDYIRGQSVIEAKLDALGSKLEAAQLRAVGASDAKH
ncbi:hypothetical protein H0I39_01840 [Ottowia beijingensis]|uniref:Uncharacterized protein n=1 Tax=Ottowia beijingensis TaxID=1207057 RepID=A0A853IT33_9BURK|nr:hypothetical protein [Ottowia beijingensis]NZA00834.1 hypothetical protein [Ottowia beijingensis]